MRISDWSSDVCSSDLKDGEWIVLHGYGVDKAGALALLQRLGAEPALPLPLGEVDQFAFDEAGARLAWSTRSADGTGNALQLRQLDSGVTRVLDAQAGAVYRSEEHTSELQSLMRISYAVFCLKKQKD